LILSSCIIIAYTYIDHTVFKKQFNSITVDSGLKKIYRRESFFLDRLLFAKETLLAIKENTHLLNYAKKRQKKEEIELLFKTIIKSDTSIMQIRFIDEKGMENIRYDRDKQNQILHIKHLQDKSSRHYFQKTKEVQNGIVWFSKLDLNIENGDLDIPFNPTYRVSTPIIIDGTFHGIVIINYFAQPIIEKLFDSSMYDAIIIDEDGYIIYHYDTQKSWSKFQKNPFKIKEKYLQLLNQTTYKGEDFAFKVLDLPFENQMYLILQLSENNQKREHAFYIKRAIIVISSFILLLSILIYFIFSRFEKDKKRINKLNKLKLKQEDIIKQKAKMAAMGEMIANIAHQWRQPLSVLSLNVINLEIKLQKNKVDEEFLKNYITNTDKTIQNMNQTIKDFSNFFEPTKEKTFFTINNLIEEALHIVHNSFQESNLKVILNIKQQYTIFGYKGELLQVILNILNNTKDAILFNKQNKGVITIKVEEKSEMIVITFEDDAGGIKDEIINRIFEPYFTTKFKNQGTGIGLYMCKVIIEESMKGSLEIKNYQNGVQCTIMIPKD
jgi:signal transduction histidine kinase